MAEKLKYLNMNALLIILITGVSHAAVSPEKRAFDELNQHTLKLYNSATETSPAKNKEMAMTEQHIQFIATGRVVLVTFGDFAFRLDFTDGQTMTFSGIGEASQGITDTVQYTAIEIRPQVYMVYWHEPKSGDNVTHIQDYQRGEAYTNIASKDGSFTHLKGQLKLVDNSGK